MARPQHPRFPEPVAIAAAQCFKAGDTVRGVAAAVGVNASSVLKALDRGRQPGAPLYLKRMAQACDSNRDTRKSLRLDLSAAMAQYETDLHADGRWSEQAVLANATIVVSDHRSA